MKKLLIFCAVSVVAVAANTSMAGYFVDLGSDWNPSGAILADWGPVQPTTSGGNWGNLASDPGSLDKLCRTVWGHTGDLMWATIKFPTAITSVEIRHLDGIADDSFAVNILPSGASWGGYTWSGNTSEYWVVSNFSGPAGDTLIITATGAQWSGFATYGQLGIDWIDATPIPEPATMLLLGLGGLSLLRKRRS